MRASDFIRGSVREARRPLPQPSSLEQKSFGDVSAALGKGKTTALLKHPWFNEYSSYDKAYKHGVDRAQFHEVEVYPYMDSVHRNAEGKIRPTIMLRFHFSDSGKISQVHKYMRDKEPGEEEKMHPGSGWRHVKSWKKSDINEDKTTISQLYSGNYPDRDETFWDYVRPDEFDTPLEVKILPKYKLRIMLQGQYRVEHLDEILDMMDEDQRETLERYMGDPRLSNKIILLSGDRIIDGNHRALAAAMKGVSINYVDLADLDGEDLSESKHGVTPTGYTWSFEHGGEVPYKSDVEVNTFIRVSDSKGKTVLGVWADVYRDDVEIQYSEVFDKKLRGKGIYTDFLKGLAKHYNIISDQDQNNAARSIYKKLGAEYNSRSERHTLRRSSQSVAENNENNGGDYAIHLGNLKRFFKAEDPLEELVPERRTHYYALHSDMFKDDGSALPWRKTFASLTGKDFKEVLHNPRILSGYRPKKYPIPPGTLVGDMHLANLYYSKVFAKTPEEKQEIARQYKESLVPLEVADLSKYKKPELLIPKGQGVAEDNVDEAKRRKRKKYHTPGSITTGWWSGYYGDGSSGGDGGGGE